MSLIVRNLRTLLLLACALGGVCIAIVVTGQLQSDATAARDAELTLSAIRVDLLQMRDVPWGAMPDEGGDPDDVRAELQEMQEKIEASFAHLSSGPGLPQRERIMQPFERTTGALWDLFDAAKEGDHEAAGEASGFAAREMYVVDDALKAAGEEYRADSARGILLVRAGSITVFLLLFGAFAWFYGSAVKRHRTAVALATENRRLLAASREEALTDALTGLGNRRALINDLEAAVPGLRGTPAMLALFDLDGFKQYNDTFGHPAGDALLARLGERLATTMAGIGSAYRIGGDEFCVLASVEPAASDAIAGLAASALSDSGEGFTIGCSCGIAVLPVDTTRPDRALLLADQRMYDQKRGGRSSATRQSAAVLLKLIDERSSELGQHTGDVSTLAERTAAQLGLGDFDQAQIRLAAQLHDVGKAAIPDAILDKPGKLDPEEWEFIRRHSEIGERIVAAAPSLAHAAPLVRSHHERYDGTGYPDRLAAEDIPVGARVIAVADAFDAMITDRPYQAGVSVDEALAELRRCAGSQFDPAVVDAFHAVLAETRVQRVRD